MVLCRAQPYASVLVFHSLACVNQLFILGRELATRFHGAVSKLPHHVSYRGFPFACRQPGRYPAALNFLMDTLLGWIPRGEGQIDERRLRLRGVAKAFAGPPLTEQFASAGRFDSKIFSRLSQVNLGPDITVTSAT